MSIAIVTPIGNEIKTIEKYFNELFPVLDKYNAHWICVFDSYCVDGTNLWLSNNKKGNVSIININGTLGLAQAYIEGNKFAISTGAKKIIEVDIGHPVCLLPSFIYGLDRHPLVVGTRYRSGFSRGKLLSRRFISLSGTILSRLLLGLKFSDCTSGFQGFNDEVARKIPWDNFISTGYFYQTEFKFYCKNIPFEEIPFNYNGGDNRLRIREVVGSFMSLMRLINKNPINW